MSNQSIKSSINATTASDKQNANQSTKGEGMNNTATQKIKPVSVATATAMMNRIEIIATEVSAWEMGAYAESNSILYGLIQKAYALYKELTNTNDSNLRYKKQGLNDYLCLKAMSAYVDKPLTTKVVRALFGNRDRRRLSTYNTVLKFLVKMDFEISEIPSKITEFGGVQEISLGRPEGFVSPKERAHLAAEAVSDISVATFSSNRLKKQINADAVGEKFAAVLTYESDGSFSVNCVLQSSTAVNTTLTAYYNSQKKLGKEKTKENEVSKKQITKAQAISYAVTA